MSIFRILAFVPILFLLNACYTIPVSVENFSNFPDGYVGKKISVHNYVEHEENGLEWNRYKPTFEREFRKQGFIITEPNDADYWAFVDYGISGPTRIQKPIYDYSTGEVTTIVSKNVYAKRVVVDVVDPYTEARVFEGQADSTGVCGRLGKVIDEMAEAIFRKFPSGHGSMTFTATKVC